MRKIIFIHYFWNLVIFLSFSSTVAWGETLRCDAEWNFSWCGEVLLKRQGLYYQPFTDVPFTGIVTGAWSGIVKDGKKEGLWRYYRPKGGQLYFKGKYTKGEREGFWREFNNSSSAQVKSKIYWWNGNRHGPSCKYEFGPPSYQRALNKEQSGIYENGKLVKNYLTHPQLETGLLESFCKED